jgi:hypothetical protein
MYERRASISDILSTTSNGFSIKKASTPGTGQHFLIWESPLITLISTFLDLGRVGCEPLRPP